MAYVEPTSGDLTTRHPEFTVVSGARIDLFLAEAIAEVDDSWLDLDRARAQIALACHNMAIAGEPATSGGSPSKRGPVESKTVGDVTTKWGKWRESESDGYSSTIYDSTVYGTEYFMLLNRNHGGPRVI